MLLAIAALALGWFPQELLRRFVEKRIRADVGPQARLGRLVVRPLLLEATIDDLVFPGTGYLIDVPRMRVVLSAESLLMRTLSLASLELYAPRITVQVLPAGGSSGAPAPSLPPIVARHLPVAEGTLRAVVPDEGDIVVRGIDHGGGDHPSLPSEQDHQLVLTPSGIALRSPWVAWQRPSDQVGFLSRRGRWD